MPYALCSMILWPHLILFTQLPLHSFYIFWHSTKLKWTRNERAQHISWGHIVSLTFYPYPITIFGTLPPFCKSDSAFFDVVITLDSNVKTTLTPLTLTFYNFGLWGFNNLDMWPFRLFDNFRAQLWLPLKLFDHYWSSDLFWQLLELQNLLLIWI